MEFGASVSEILAVEGPAANFLTYVNGPTGTDGQLNPGVETGQAAGLLGHYPSFPFTTTPDGPDLNSVPSTTQPVGLDLAELQEMNIALALTSPNQFREKLTLFWETHFNTNWGKLSSALQQAPFSMTPAQANDYATHFEWAENAGFRANALGEFRELLEISARGVAMSIYLDGIKNHDTGPGAEPNQNFGRELLELHTLGVEGWAVVNGAWVKRGTYVFSDIEAMSRVFSGFELVCTASCASATPQLTMQFNGNLHFVTGAAGSIPVFASNPLFGSFPFPLVEDTTAPSEADAALDYLAGHPHTAMHVITKLWELLIGGDAPDPSNATFQQAFSVWGSRGDIHAVVSALLGSPEFLTTPANRWNHARLPLEIVGQLFDTMNGELFDPAATPAVNRAKLAHIRTAMSDEMGRTLFRYPAPDGFPFEPHKQLTTMRILAANRLRQELYSNFDFGLFPGIPYGSGSIRYDILGLTGAFGVNLLSETDLADFLCTVHFADDHWQQDELDVIDVLSRDVSGNPAVPLAAAPPLDALERVARGLAFAASMSLNNLK